MQKVIYFFILIFSGMGLFLFFTSNNNLSLSDIPKQPAKKMWYLAEKNTQVNQ